MRLKSPRQNQSGFAALIILLILGIMLAMVMANTNALFQLKREIKNVDKRQQARWTRLNTTTTATNKPLTNTPPAAAVAPK
jgi:type II secretory pathway component PulK